MQGHDPVSYTHLDVYKRQVFYFLKFGSQGKKSDTNLMTLQVVGPKDDFLTYDEGSAPKLSNEIAVSKKMSEKKDWHVGDTIETNLHDGKHSFIITGLYTDYMQVGESARMNPSFDQMCIRDRARGCTIISTPYDAFTVARLINQSIPVEFFMRTDHLIAFEDTDYIDEVKDVMASKRHRCV